MEKSTLTLGEADGIRRLSLCWQRSVDALRDYYEDVRVRYSLDTYTFRNI
jgi:hypothetical protein